MIAGDKRVTLELFSAAAQAGEENADPAFADRALRFTLVFSDPVDIALQRQRLQSLFGGQGFNLGLAGAGVDRDMLLLEFPGVAREQSAAFLFDSAQQLADELNLVACVPDADPTWAESDELGRDLPETVPGVVRRLCEPSAPVPDDPQWAVKLIRAPRHGAASARAGGGYW